MTRCNKPSHWDEPQDNCPMCEQERQTMNATPRPWAVLDATEPDKSFADRFAGIYICGPVGEGYKAYIMPQGSRTTEKEIAELIVRAVNSFDAMREALASAVARIELANVEGNPIMSAWLSDAKAALSLADGREDK